MRWVEQTCAARVGGNLGVAHVRQSDVDTWHEQQTGQSVVERVHTAASTRMLFPIVQSNIRQRGHASWSYATNVRYKRIKNRGWEKNLCPMTTTSASLEAATPVLLPERALFPEEGPADDEEASSWAS